MIPAIDVLDGRVVRLAQGRREAVTLEGGDPVALARRYERDGASRLHVVDLGGAFGGAPTPGLLESLVEATELPVQIGGGYRTLAAIAGAVAAGADRVMIGTATLEPGFLEQVVGRFGNAIVVAVDVRDGLVATSGWTETSQTSASELAIRCAAVRVPRLLVTSTHRDGSLAGPDLDLLGDIVTVGLPVIAAGGIASVDDLRAARDLGCEAAIAGSALLAGRFTLPGARAALTG